MQKLRSLHLYLGCQFAPMLLFFAASGLWQTLGWRSKLLTQLSTLHTGAVWKNGGEWGSYPFRLLVALMAVSFAVSIILGVLMAFRFGRSRKAASGCLALGVIIPLGLVLAHIFR